MTIFSDWATAHDFLKLRGPMRHFGSIELPPNSDLDAEWFAWMLDELIAEGNCYLIIEKTTEDRYGYVQFAAGPSGELVAETQSDEFRDDEHKFSVAEQLRLIELGWNLPNCSWPAPRDSETHLSPNYFRYFEDPAPSGEVALLALRTLRELYGTIKVRDLAFVFFRARETEWDSPARRRDFPDDSFDPTEFSEG
jgi:hypothetical protein